MTSRKKPTAGFWTIVVVTVLLAYPLSIVPASWTLDLLEDPPAGVAAYELIYAPILWLYMHGPDPIADLLYSYWHLWHRD